MRLQRNTLSQHNSGSPTDAQNVIWGGCRYCRLTRSLGCGSRQPRSRGNRVTVKANV